MSDAPSTGPSTGPDDDPWWNDEPEGSPHVKAKVRGSRRMWAIVGAGAVLVVAVGAGFLLSRSSHSTSAAGSANGTTSATGRTARFGRRRPGTQGTITAISGSNLTVTTRANTAVKVAATGSTTITDTVKGSLGELKVGDHVRVVGATANPGVVTAQAIIDSRDMVPQFGRGGAGGLNGAPPGGAGSTFRRGAGSTGQPPNGPRFNGSQGGLTAGTISSINGSTVVVKTDAGRSDSVTTGSATMVRLTTKIGLADLAKGDMVSVTGTTTNGTLNATAIRRGDSGFQLGGPGGPGLGGPPPDSTP